MLRRLFRSASPQSPAAPQTGVQAHASGIILEHVSLQRGSASVLHDISLNMSERRIGLIGDNGSGKSSLARLLNGLLKPQHGGVHVFGHDALVTPKALPGLVGLIFQNPDHQIIFPTVCEELAFGPEQNSMARKAARAHALEFLRAQGHADWANRPVQELSEGQKQLVCILAVLIMEPRLLIFDEPFSNLDLSTRYQMCDLIDTLPQQVIMISHDLEILDGYDRVIWLEQGRVRMDGKPEDVLDAYRRNARTATPVALGDQDKDAAQ